MRTNVNKFDEHELEISMTALHTLTIWMNASQTSDNNSQAWMTTIQQRFVSFRRFVCLFVVLSLGTSHLPPKKDSYSRNVGRPTLPLKQKKTAGAELLCCSRPCTRDEATPMRTRDNKLGDDNKSCTSKVPARETCGVRGPICPQRCCTKLLSRK